MPMVTLRRNMEPTIVKKFPYDFPAVHGYTLHIFCVGRNAFTMQAAFPGRTQGAAYYADPWEGRPEWGHVGRVSLSPQGSQFFCDPSTRPGSVAPRRAGGFFWGNGVDHAVDLGILVGNPLKLERVATGRGAGRNSPLFLWLTPLTRGLTFPLPGMVAGGSHPLWPPVASFLGVAPRNHPATFPPARRNTASASAAKTAHICCLPRPKEKGRSFPPPRPFPFRLRTPLWRNQAARQA